jgi:peptide/nickel transport system substrate-binding protein
MNQGGGGGRAATSPNASRTVVLISGAELPSFAAKPLTPSASSPRAGISGAVLNANLVYLDERGLPKPFLADALPELNTGTWQVFPDGRMETTYRLRPNLVWHDGQPLLADDFVFAWRVYATPEFGIADTVGFRSIEEVAAPDPRSVVIRWKERYTDAGQVSIVLPPLPRHILDTPFRDAPSSFAGLPFWTTEYVGLGPWKLDRREPGSFFEGSAFDRFVFGRPKIDRIRVQYQIDPNIVVATMLAGDGHLTDSALLHGEDGVTLEQGWAFNHAGIVQWSTDIGKAQEIQARPEFAVPTQLATDARVRQALAFALDRVTLTEVATAGKGVLREIFSHPNVDYYATALDTVRNRYPYDQRRAEGLLVQAGFSRAGDGAWLLPNGQPFTLSQWGLGGTTDEKDSAIVLDSYRRFGIDASSMQFATQRSSQEERSAQPGLLNGSINLPDVYHSRNAARPETRWMGTNRYGFSNPEMDRYVDAYLTDLDRSERVNDLSQVERVAMEQLPAIPTYFHAAVMAQSAALKNVVVNLIPGAGQERMMWSWEWTR